MKVRKSLDKEELPVPEFGGVVISFYWQNTYCRGYATLHTTHVCSTVSTTVLCDPFLL
jgi:hypothetical protein